MISALLILLALAREPLTMEPARPVVAAASERWCLNTIQQTVQGLVGPAGCLRTERTALTHLRKADKAPAGESAPPNDNWEWRPLVPI